MNTTTNGVIVGSGPFTSRSGLPSGTEVESAVFHEPIHAVSACDVSSAHERSRLQDLKARGLSKLNDVKSQSVEKMEHLRSVGIDRLHHLQHSLSDRSVSARDGLRTGVAKVQDSMRVSPMKWAGVAAGSGLVLGLAGRLMRSRSHRSIPQLVIIESTC